MSLTALPVRMIALALLATLAGSAGAATSQEDPGGQPASMRPAESEEPRLEIGLLGGRRVGGLLRVDTDEDIPLDVRDASAYGGRLAWRLGDRVTLQLEASHQATTLARRHPDDAAETVAHTTLDYLQAGPRVRLSDGPLRVNLFAGVGVLRLRSRDPDASDVFPSVSVGPGLLVPASARVAFIGDLRLFTSLIGRDTSVPCQRPEAGCLRTGNDTVLLQIQLFGGLAVRF